MNSKRLLTAAAFMTWAFVATQTTRAEEPKVNRVARQRFVALLTSVRPELKVKPVKATTTESLKAFGGRGAGTPIR